MIINGLNDLTSLSAISESAPFAPTNISNLSLWLRADLGITMGTGVSRWADQSGNGNDVVQATGADQPTVQPVGINGLPSIQFNGSTQFLQNTAFSITSPLTFIVVTQFAASADVVEMAYGFSGGGACYLDSSDLDDGEGFYFNGIQINITPPGPGNPAIVTALADGTENSFLQNGGVVVNALTTNGTISDLFVGCFEGEDFHGKWISEIIFYSKALSSNELSEVWSYLQKRYQLLA